MRQMSRVAIALTALALAPPAHAASSAGYGKGGRTKDFLPLVQQYNGSGEQFRITGHCQSACTMFLAIRSVCIEPSARLLFHAGENDLATSRMFNSYNGRLKAHLTATKAMETAKFYAISGKDMISKFGYRACPGK
jgi:hypothetical protein